MPVVFHRQAERHFDVCPFARLEAVAGGPLLELDVLLLIQVVDVQPPRDGTAQVQHVPRPAPHPQPNPIL